MSNTGSRRGSTEVQVYVRRPGSGIRRADRELKGFQKLDLGPGGSEVVSLMLSPSAFRHWDVGDGGWRIEGGPAEILVGESSRNVHLRARVDLSGMTLDPSR